MKKFNFVAVLLIIGLILVVGYSIFWKSSEIQINLPIDNEKEAISYAKMDSDVQQFMKKWSDASIKSWANFDKEKDVWAVGIYPDNVEDVWYEIHFDSNGKILSKGRGIGA